MKKRKSETSLVVQGLRLCPFNTGSVGSIPGWGTKIPHAMLCDQKKKKEKKKQGRQERAKHNAASLAQGETPRAQTSTWLW